MEDEKEAAKKTISDLKCENFKCLICDSNKPPPTFKPPLNIQKSCSNLEPLCKPSEKSSQGG